MKTTNFFLTAILTAFMLLMINVKAQETARIQIIHNSADAAAAVVDVWLNETKLIENFSFRTATPFIDAPAGVLLNIGIAPPSSTSWTQSFRIKQVVLTTNQTYVALASGIVSTSGYSPSPLFKVDVLPIGREVASQPGNTDILVVHGSTDAPTVDIYETGVGLGQIVNNLIYGNVAGYLEVATDNYIIEVRDQTGTVTVAAYQAPLSALGLEGQALSVLASGFLNPANNSNGPAFGLYVALPTGGDLIELPAYTPSTTARLQVIHNSADAAAAVVDVWANNTKLIENFAFRTATPFVDVPAGTPITISITGPGSTSPTPNVFETDVTFANGETYVVVANGIVSASGYSPDQPFNLYTYDMGREESTSATNTDVLAFHGSTDAPVVSLYETGQNIGLLASNFVYGNYAGYFNFPTNDYILEVRDQTGTVTVAAYEAPLATLALEGEALTVLASGFLDPSQNSNGPAFGLYVALAAGGDLIPLPVYSSAMVQIIHNSADAAAAVVDVWANNEKLLEDFEFRTATPFVSVPGDTPITISITGPGSTSPEPNVFQADVTFETGETYVVVANGIVSASGYTPGTPFNLYVNDMGRRFATSALNTDVLAFHGSTDAPTVSVWETGVGAGELFSFAYGDYAGYLELPTDNYILEVRDETGTVTVAAYQAPLAALGLEGEALSVIASGFLNPANNSNGPAFGLYVALASGGELVELPVYTSSTARLQVIHNSADAAAAVVDVWANGDKLLENFEFRTATPFVDVPAETPVTISITGPGSTSPTPNVFEADVTFADGETYVVVANGIVSASGYSPDQPFNLYIYDMGREEATSATNTDVLAFHGSTDAPTVSVWETGVGAGELFTFAYGDFAGYLELPTDNYIIEVRDETGTVTVAAYEAPLAVLGLEGEALSVIASGFLNPANNSNGPAFGLFVALASGGELVELPVYTPPTARLQVIHNSADAAAEVVDVWANGEKLLENFTFRTATPFVDVPAETPVTISITGPGSTSPTPNVFEADVTFADGETYVVVANGIVSASGYSPDQPFNLYIYDMGREEATSATNTDVLAFHGSTDAPTVSVWETGVGAGELFTFAYGDYAGYLELPTDNYILEVRDETGTVTVAAYQAPLAALGLEGEALSVVASGFLNPANNSNGPAFGLYVALASGGELVELPVYTPPTARLQVIHNSADAAAEVVDVWANGEKLLENFTFRTATPFVDVPAETPVTISITGPGSTSPAPNVFEADVTFADGETYVVVANGIVSASGYSPDQPFNLYIYDMGREEATSATNTDVLAFHGSTDAPTVSVWETGVGAGELFTFAYGDFAEYLELPTDNYIIEVRDETGTVTVAAYEAPLAALGLEGEALSVIASGFLNPGQNSNGAAFGLFVALADGGELVELPLYLGPMARLQVIHNSADAAAAVVDVWANDEKLLENFAFRTATPFVDVPAETPITISITGPGSTSPTPSVFEADVTFADGETYVVVANGIVSASGYSPDQPFNLYIYDMGRETATSPDNTDVLVFHGSTDAPTVSIWESGVGAGELFTFSYGDFAGYLELPTDNYTIDVRDESGEVTVASYYTPLATLGLDGQALTVVASGFLTPGQNSNGPAFGLFVALTSGGELVELPLSDPTGVNNISFSESMAIFPNPAYEFVNLNISLNNPGNVKVEMLDLLGKTVNAIDLGWQNSINNYRIDVSTVPKGIYFLKVDTGSMSYIEKLIISR